MGLPNVNIILGNGNIGSVSISDDGIAGMVLTGATVDGKDKLALGKAYVLGSFRDLEALGVTEENNPLAYKEVAAFYTEAGDGAELHIIIVSEATTLTQMCGTWQDSPVNKLIRSAGGRIRLLGLNRNTPESYVPTLSNGLDEDVKTGIAAAQAIAENFASQVWAFRAFLPAIGWNGTSEDLYKPREGSQNRVALVMGSDGIFGKSKLYSAAIGQVLGRAAKISVHRSIARVRDGAIAVKGYFMDGKIPEEQSSLWNTLNDAGYIFYRTFVGKNGYYLNDDPMCAPTTDDYAYLNLGRVIDKAISIAYLTYIDDLMDNVEVDDKGQISAAVCKSFEAAITRAVNTNMSDEISSFSAYVNPAQDILSTGSLSIQCKIVPQGILREINVNLSFNNPTA